jgi:hypothetical protein
MKAPILRVVVASPWPETGDVFPTIAASPWFIESSVTSDVMNSQTFHILTSSDFIKLSLRRIILICE